MYFYMYVYIYIHTYISLHICINIIHAAHLSHPSGPPIKALDPRVRHRNQTQLDILMRYPDLLFEA